MSTLTISSVEYIPSNNNSSLITNKNYDKCIINNYADYHTTVSDLDSNKIIELVKQIDKVFFVEDFFDKTSSIYSETIALLNYIQHFVPIYNYNIDNKIDFTNNKLIYTHPGKPTLWVFGCSHSHGVGLASNELRYANIISRKLNMPLKLISQPGSSTNWSLRHCINANIRCDDIVVWQLTTPDRITLNNKKLAEVMLSNTSQQELIKVYSDDQVFFEHLNLVNIGVRYLQSKKIKFVLTAILNNQRLFYNYLQEYTKYSEYCYAPNFNVDLGSDNLHFGPNSHANLATAILSHLEQHN
jgi:hypothetical protein